MHLRAALVLTLGLAACSRDRGPTEAGLEEGETEGFSISGTVYGFTGAPDSQRVAIAGALVTFVRIGDVVDTPDTVSVPDTLPPPGGDTLLTVRHALHGGVFLLDSVIPPPGSCSDGDPAPGVTTDAAGSFTVGGLAEGMYALMVGPPAGGGWGGLEYCSFELRSDWPIPFDVYLTAGD